MTVRVTGTVLDERGNGVPWVSISNGEFVVRTDARGRYEIEAEPGSHSFITVSAPDTHRTVGGFYRRVPESNSTFDFTLRSTPERQYEKFTLAQITDTHVRTEPYYRPQGAWLGPETGPRLTSDLRQLERESRPDLVLATGDLTDIGTTAELEHFRNSIAPIETPIRPVYGGHDGHVELEAQGGNRDKYEYVEGVSCIQNYQGVLGPVYYSFDWGGRHFVAFSKEDSYFTQADIARKDRWLIEDLSAQQEGRETVLFMHTPPAVEFLDLLGRYNVKLVLFGHTHCSKAFRYNGMTVGGPTPLCFGGYDGNSRGYRLVRFTEDGFEFDLVQQTTQACRSARPTRVLVGAQGEELNRLWSHALPGPTHRAAPVRHGDNLLYSVTDDNLRGNAGVYSIDFTNGRRNWHVPTDTSVKNAVAVGEDGLAVATSVAGRCTWFRRQFGATRVEPRPAPFPRTLDIHFTGYRRRHGLYRRQGRVRGVRCQDRRRALVYDSYDPGRIWRPRRRRLGRVPQSPRRRRTSHHPPFGSGESSPSIARTARSHGRLLWA